jgi:hypothetical protein
MSTVRLGIADHIGDLHRVFDIGKAAGVTIVPEDGSGSAAYAFSIEECEWVRARAALSASHLFRSGDLHVFLHDQPIPRDRKLTKEEREPYSTWRLSLRTQENFARKNPFE